MNTNSNVSARRTYILSTKDVESLTAEMLASIEGVSRGQSTILKGLVATTQAELGVTVRKTAAKLPMLEDNARAAHLAAFEAVYGRFYEAVVHVAEATVPEPDSDELKRRTGFCRSAGSTVRSYIRAGNDITGLAAHKVTKAALAVPRARRKFTVDALRKRAERLTAELHAVLRNLQAANSEIARPAVASTLASVVSITDIVGNAKKDHNAAVAGGLPFSTRTDVFVPINLAAVRAAKKAA